MVVKGFIFHKLYKHLIDINRMEKKTKSNKKPKEMVITQKEHDEWHKKQGDKYTGKTSKEHELCHRRMGIVVKK